jgi:hypothetical protein
MREQTAPSPSVCAEQRAEAAGRGTQVSITPITDRAGCVANFVAVQQARARLHTLPGPRTLPRSVRCCTTGGAGRACHCMLDWAT